MSLYDLFELRDVPWKTFELSPSAPVEEPPCWINLEAATRILLSGSQHIRAAILDHTSHTTKAVTAKKEALLRATKSGRVGAKGQLRVCETLYFLTRDLLLTRDKWADDHRITISQWARSEVVDFQSSFISFCTQVGLVQLLHEGKH